MTVTLANSSTTSDWHKRPLTDFYPTPWDVTQSLIDFLMLPKTTTIWEPAAGEGHMAKVLESNGYTVRSSDIQAGEDFLLQRECLGDFIITNPPFIVAEEFIKHSNWLTPKCGFAFLLKSQYWHSAKRFKLFQSVPPQFVCPLTWRPDFLFGAKSGAPTMEVLWTIWFNPKWQECYEGATVYKPLDRPKKGQMSL